MTTSRRFARWVLAAALGLVSSGSDVQARDTAAVVKFQGTWSDASGASGTWRADLKGGSDTVLGKDAEFGEWDSFQGTARIDAESSVEDNVSIVAWAVPDHIALRIVDGEWKETLFSGALVGSQAQGTFRRPSGATGEWRGWWITVRDEGARIVASDEKAAGEKIP
ncbi:MAG: hypothetical protein SF182_01790 [Deltaproteobacteria bacterium]|nr:hypothetical protein [Deltaproteobacteria bacterium]